MGGRPLTLLGGRRVPPPTPQSWLCAPHLGGRWRGRFFRAKWQLGSVSAALGRAQSLGGRRGGERGDPYPWPKRSQWSGQEGESQPVPPCAPLPPSPGSGQRGGRSTPGSPPPHHEGLFLSPSKNPGGSQGSSAFGRRAPGRRGHPTPRLSRTRGTGMGGRRRRILRPTAGPAGSVAGTRLPRLRPLPLLRLRGRRPLRKWRSRRPRSQPQPQLRAAPGVQRFENWRALRRRRTPRVTGGAGRPGGPRGGGAAASCLGSPWPAASGS